MDKIESEWRHRLMTKSIKRWVLKGDNIAPERETKHPKYKKQDMLKLIDNHWHVWTDQGLKEIIFPSNSFNKIQEEMQKSNCANNKEFVNDFLAKFAGILRKDLEWLVVELSKIKSQRAALPGRPPKSI
jgi:hypothetical protein